MRTHLPVFSVGFLCTALIISLQVKASGNLKSTAKDLLQDRGWSFVQNIGQLNGQSPLETPYFGEYRGGTVLFRHNEVQFLIYSVESDDQVSEASGQVAGDERKTILKRSTLTMRLAGANEYTRIEAGAKQQQVYNYYLSHCPDGVFGAGAFNELTYRNVYDNIDLVFRTDKEGLKYEFVVHPGGEISDISMYWDGALPLVANNGSVTYAGAHHAIQESAPLSFLTSGEKIQSAFSVKDNRIGFSIGKYDHSKTLIIDPLLRWGTYYGGHSLWGGPEEDIVADIKVDSDGNIYLAGNTTSGYDIATAGAYQEDYVSEINHYYNMFVSKFSPDGQLVWGTYYGDTTKDEAFALEVDNNNDVYMAGHTLSPYKLGTAGTHMPQNSIPDSSHKQSYGGILVKFDSSGKRQWGTYFGGYGHDGLRDIVADKDGHIYAVGFTLSDSAVATSGLDTTYGGRHSTASLYAGDAVIAKFKASAGKLVWSTYYGGSRDDWATAIALDADGKLVVGGNTYSSLAIATVGAYQQTIANTATTDAFIARFDTSGNLFRGTYYGGTAADICTGIKIDKQDNIILAGNTYSSSLSSSGAIDAMQQDMEVFIVKFNSLWIRQWATYYGGAGADELGGMDVDSLNKVYILMETTDEGLATHDAYRDSVSAVDAFKARDVLMLILDENGDSVYSTYYGGRYTERAGGIVCDPKGAIYIAGLTTSNTGGIATYNTHRNTQHGYTDAFLVKFDTLGMCEGLYTEINGPDAICAGQLAIYTTPYDPDNVYQWEVNGGQIVFGEYSDSMGVKWNPGVIGKLKVIAINEYNCEDSSTINVAILPEPVSSFSASNSCLGDTLVFTNADTTAVKWLWEFGDGTTSDDSIAEHVYQKTGLYTIKGTIWNMYGCSSDTEMTIQVSTVSAAWTATLEFGRLYTFTATDTTQTAYYWDFGDGAKDTGHTVVHGFSANGNYTVTLQVTNGFGCTATRDSIVSPFINGIASAQDMALPTRFYPNPLSGHGWLEYRLSSSEQVSVSMYDLAGREVMSRDEGFLPPGKYTLSIDASSYEPGIYHMVLRAGTKQSSHRIMIK